MPRRCAIGIVKTITASGFSVLDEALEVPLPARRDPARDRLARELVERRLLGARLGAAEVAVALHAREHVADRLVRLALAVGRVRRGSPPGRLDRPAAIRRDDEVDAGLVHPLPELPPGRRAAVAEVEVDRGRGREDLRASASVRPSPRDHRGDRLGDDRDVEPDRPVLEVREVEPDEVVERRAPSGRRSARARSSRAARE